MEIVKCANCADFIPNKDYRKPGQCKTFEAGKKTATDRQIAKAYAARGGCEFLDCTRHICAVFTSAST